MLDLTAAQWRALAGCTDDDGYHSFVLCDNRNAYAGSHNMIARVTDLTWDTDCDTVLDQASAGRSVKSVLHGYSPKQCATALMVLDRCMPRSFEQTQLHRVADTCAWFDRLTASGELGCTVRPDDLQKALKVVAQFANIETCNVCFKSNCVVLDAQDARGYRRVTCYVQGGRQDA